VKYHFVVYTGLFSLMVACDPTPATDLTCGASTDEYSAGMRRVSASGDVELELLAATPAPPDRGDNTWTFALYDVDGQPLEGATGSFGGWMSAHGHGSNPETVRFSDNGDGTYTTDVIDLYMSGVWDLTITLDGDTADEVTFAFCIDG
jgi:hypothetical protein